MWHITRKSILSSLNLPILQRGLQPRTEKLFADHINLRGRGGFYGSDRKIFPLAPIRLTCFAPGDLRQKTIAGEHWSMSTVALVNSKSVPGVSELGQHRLMEEHYRDSAE